ncbi:MAG TPA: hypothetical protein VGW39_00230 [Chthoniobacterales bacterium]|nr:hypothetical protein [Chthoniobacterales bacterium]
MNFSVTAADTAINIAANTLTVIVSVMVLCRFAAILRRKRQSTATSSSPKLSVTRSSSMLQRALNSIIVASLAVLGALSATSPRAPWLGFILIPIVLFSYVLIIVSRGDGS